MLATCAFLVAVSLFVIGSYILTWPLLRLSPRERRIRATVDFASSAMATLTAFTGDKAMTQLAPDDADDTDDPDEPLESHRYVGNHKSGCVICGVPLADHPV